MESTRSLGAAASAALATTLVLGLPCGPAPALRADPDSTRHSRPADYTFVSSPDFLNRDIGDISDRAADWSGVTFHYEVIDGVKVQVNTPPDYVRNSTSPEVEVALGAVLDDWKSYQPGDVLVAGDLVEGVWHEDSYRTGIFGPLGSVAQKNASVRRAADTYYGQWTQRFRDHGLSFQTAIGDHDIGDNYWLTNSYHHAHVALYKHLYAEHLTAGGTKGFSRPAGPAHETAYATWVDRDPRVLVVSLDVFEKLAASEAPGRKDGVVSRLDPQQLAWLQRLLRHHRTRADWIIVQGHTPVLGPVNRASSSGLMYGATSAHPTGTGARSDLWRTMARNGVDLYLAGEVHDLTVRRAGGVTQVSHGGPFPDRADYLVGRITGDTMELSVHDQDVATREGPLLWQLLAYRMFLRSNVVMGQPRVAGTMRLTSRGRVLDSTGALRQCRARWTPSLASTWRKEKTITPCPRSHLPTFSRSTRAASTWGLGSISPPLAAGF